MNVSVDGFGKSVLLLRYYTDNVE